MQGEASSSVGTPARILVVDDQSAHAELLAEALVSVGHECRVATSVDEAKELLRKEGADIVITDLVLGDRDGLDLIREAQSIDPFIAVVVVTGHGTVETAGEAMQLGGLPAEAGRPDRSTDSSRTSSGGGSSQATCRRTGTNHR